MQGVLGGGRSRSARRWPAGCARALAAAAGLLCPVLALISAAAAAAAGPVGAAAAAGPVGAAAFSIRSASLTQDGQQLRWKVVLDHDFSGAAFAGGQRTLCLLVESGHAHSVKGQLCVAAPRGPHKTMRLTFASVTRAGAGRAAAVPATITRGARDELTAVFVPTAVDPSYRSLHWQVQSTYQATAVAFPAHPALSRLHTPKLVGCVAGGPSIVYSGPTSRHEIALTFDDGPWGTPPSMQFVNLLARYHAPATFFEIGSQISEYDPTGSIERAMLADGDMIGDHTWTHPDMTTLSPPEQTSQLQMTAGAIRHATGFTPCLWRPPYGALDGPLVSLARQLNLTTIDWNIDPRDWALPGVGSIEQTVLSNAVNGGIVEMHFGGGPRYETYDALPTIITTLRRRGYQFVNLAQMLGLRMIYR